MAEQKTQPTQASVKAFLDRSAPDQERRADCETLIRIMKKATGEPPRMWGPTIVGFGTYHYRYASGHEGDSCLVGFSPRKGDLSIYVMGMGPERDALLTRLGKHRMGKACLYVRRLSDIDLEVLERLVAVSVKELRRLYG